MLVFTTSPDHVDELNEFVQQLNPVAFTRVLRGLGKVLASYNDKAVEEDTLKKSSTGSLPSGQQVYCQYVLDDPNHVEGISVDQSLQVPKFEKNWLISPPGSPPVGWEPIVEESPNSQHLAHDIQLKLDELGNALLNDHSAGPQIVISEHNNTKETSPSRQFEH